MLAPAPGPRRSRSSRSRNSCRSRSARSTRSTRSTRRTRPTRRGSVADAADRPRLGHACRNLRARVQAPAAGGDALTEALGRVIGDRHEHAHGALGFAIAVLAAHVVWSSGPSEQQVLEPDQRRVLQGGHAAHGQKHPGHERLAGERVVTDGQRLSNIAQ